MVGEVTGRQFTSVVAPEHTRRARELFARNLLGTAPVTDSAVVLLDNAGAHVGVEVSSVPLKRGGRVIGVFGQVSDVLGRAPGASGAPPHSPPGGGPAAARARPLDRSDRRRAPPEPRDRPQSHPPPPPGRRRDAHGSRRSRSPAASGSPELSRELTHLCQAAQALCRPPCRCGRRSGRAERDDPVRGPGICRCQAVLRASSGPAGRCGRSSTTTCGSSGPGRRSTTSISQFFCARWKPSISELDLQAIRYCLDGRFYVMECAVASESEIAIAL